MLGFPVVSEQTLYGPVIFPFSQVCEAVNNKIN